MNAKSLRSSVLLALLVVGAAALPSSLVAQRDSTNSIVVAPTHAVALVAPVVSITPSLAGGPRMVAAGISRPVATDTRALPQRPASLGSGNPVAMMVVGGAGIIVGSLVGDDAGYAIAVGGALIGLVGLFRYLR